MVGIMVNDVMVLCLVGVLYDYFKGWDNCDVVVKLDDMWVFVLVDIWVLINFVKFKNKFVFVFFCLLIVVKNVVDWFLVIK